MSRAWASPAGTLATGISDTKDVALLSQQSGFMFVHVPGTAGSSMNRALGLARLQHLIQRLLTYARRTTNVAVSDGTGAEERKVDRMPESPDLQATDVPMSEDAGRPVPHCDVLLDRMEATIRELPIDEANFHRRLRTCAAMDEELTGHLAALGFLPRALLLRADLAMELRDWPEAIRRWEKLAEHSKAHRALVYIKLSGAHRSMGHFHAAEIALTKAEKIGVGKLAKAYAKENAAVNNDIDAWMSARLAAEGVAHLAQGSRENALAMFRSALLVRRTDASTFAFADTVLHRLAESKRKYSAASRAPDGTESAPAHIRLHAVAGEFTRRPVVLTCGFVYSGSGAVTDYLREFAPVSLPFGKTELGFFEGVSGVSSILRAIIEEGAPTGDALVRFLLTQVLGLPMTAGDRSASNKVKRQALIQYFKDPDKLRRLETAFCAFAADVTAVGAADSRSVEHLVRLFFDIIVDSLTDQGRFILLNNSIHAFNISQVRLLSDPRAFIVVRDPRDQYVAKVVESGSGSSAKRFIDSYRERISSCREALDDPDVARCVDVVRFEDFVSSAQVRRAVLDRLGLSDTDRNGNQYFFPEQSRQNVGIHRDFPNQAAIERIHKELSPHLIEPTL